MAKFNLTEMAELFKKSLHQFMKANAHQKLLFTNTLFLSLLLMFLAGNIISLPLSLLFGLLYEMTYCFVPHTDVLIFGEMETLPDYPKFIKYLNHGKVINRHKFRHDNINFCIAGIIAAILLRILFIFI